jgi:glycosyltransferase involved in cell wall biosynthesis
VHTTIPVPPAVASPDSVGPTFGMLSTFPPTSCGIATFAAALSAGLISEGSTVDVVRLGESPELEDALVVASISDDAHSVAHAEVAAAAAALNRTDVVIIQHEYGLYGGEDGADVLAVMASIVVPIILVAHTVIVAPTAGQRHVLEKVCEMAHVVVVMTDTARERLSSGFAVDSRKVIVIPHGAATPLAESTVVSRPVAAWAPRLLTWGLLGPGKGIEWAIDAMAELDDLRPRPQYVVAGATHPKVHERQGEAYREMLVARAARSRAAFQVSFDDSYRDLTDLTDLIASADVVILPYDSADQVTSGVLVDAVAAGRPVIATAFPHAVELLASGAGIVVPQRDPHALADAIRAVLGDPDLAASMAAEARRLAPALSWATVADRYREVANLITTASITPASASAAR